MEKEIKPLNKIGKEILKHKSKRWLQTGIRKLKEPIDELDYIITWSQDEVKVVFQEAMRRK